MSDFTIHRNAVRIEKTLHLLMREGKKQEVDTEITRIYDAPLQVCGDVLTSIESSENLDSIQKIKAKYWPYQRYILTQLSPDFCEQLCEDLNAIHEH